jgi:hypothetical protein
MNYLKIKISRFYPITIVCFLTFLLSFASVKLSVLIGVGLSFLLVMRCRPDGLPGLFILYFSPLYFFQGFTLTLDLKWPLTIAGFPISVPIVMCGFVSLRVFLEMFLRPKTYREKIPRIILFLWMVAFLPVVVGTWMGYQEKNINWSGGLRFLMITGSYFYGYILARHWPKDRNDLLIPMLIPLVVIMLLLAALGIYFSHHLFLFMGLGGAFSVYFIKKRSFARSLLGVILLALTATWAVASTFTMLFIFLFSVLLAYLGMSRMSFIRKRVTVIIGGVGILGILAFSLGVSFFAHPLDYDSTIVYGGLQGLTMEKLQLKILADRFFLWQVSLKQILGGPYFIVPTGRPLILNEPGLPQLWHVGAHNTVFEIMRQNGFFSGTIMLIILFLALKNNLLVLKESTDPVLKSMAAAILSVGIIGMIAGDFPADQTVGFWLWGLAGLAHGLFLQANHLLGQRLLQQRPLAPRPQQRPEV